MVARRPSESTKGSEGNVGHREKRIYVLNAILGSEKREDLLHHIDGRSSNFEPVAIDSRGAWSVAGCEV